MSGEREGRPVLSQAARDFRDRLESTHAAALALLGSEQFLTAAAGGDPSAVPLLEAAAESEHAAAVTFKGWLDDTSDDSVRSAFSNVADQEAEHRRRVAVELDDWEPGDDAPGPMHAYLRGRETTLERAAGGMVGRSLVSLQTHPRLVTYFEREQSAPSARRASLFADLLSETTDTLHDGLELLDSCCETEADWETAELVAGYTITLAADDTADTLRSLGIDPEEGS